MRTYLLIAGVAVVGGALALHSFAEDAKPAARSADGKPDFSGYWNGEGGGRGATLKDDGSVHVAYGARDGDVNNFERDFAVLTRSHTNKPIYKPQYWNTIQDMDWNGLTRDPTFTCGPEGVPRLGPPEKIVQSPLEMVFLYANGVYRVIPTDGRKHTDSQVGDTTPNGYSVGHWEGDTLVIETLGFDDATWLHWTGYTHSNEMKVTEHITRKGNKLHWVATVEDDMLQEPWTMDPQEKQFNPDPKAWFWGTLPCRERDSKNIVQKNVRG